MGKTGYPAMLGILAAALALAADPPGFEAGRRVRAAGRLDWEFVAGGARLPAAHDSRRQRYQLFTPATYAKAKAWPLVVWLSPGDDPSGWAAMERPCVEGDLFFAAPYAAGAGRPLAVRVRAALDVIDDVRRAFRIDPARTYIVGQGAASVLACQIAYSLPEHFGGVAVIDGEAPLPSLAHLRHRLKGRLSVALIATEPAGRGLLEKHTAGLYRDLGVRSRLVAGKADAATLKPVIAWLEEGLDARLGELRTWRIAGKPDADAQELAAHALEQARGWMDDPAKQYLAAGVLEWLAVRHGRIEPGREARKLYDAWKADPRKGVRLAEVMAADRRPVVRATARAEERRGRLEEAFAQWMEAVRLTPDPVERGRARKEADRIGDVLGKMPYLGVTFEGESAIVRAVEAGGPAYRAGLAPGDRLRRLGPAKLETLADIKAAAARLRPGDGVEAEWQRGDAVMKRELTAGSRLAVAKAKSTPAKGE